MIDVIKKSDLESHIIHEGCDKGCGYIDERDLGSIHAFNAYTQDEVIAMLTELQDELKYTTLSGLWKSNYAEGFNDSVATSVKKIQCRIDKLKENME